MLDSNLSLSLQGVSKAYRGVERALQDLLDKDLSDKDLSGKDTIGVQILTLSAATSPALVLLDPFHKMIERTPTDNSLDADLE